MCNMMKMI